KYTLCILFQFTYICTTDIYPLSLHDALPIYSIANSDLSRSTPSVIINRKPLLQRIFQPKRDTLTLGSDLLSQDTRNMLHQSFSRDRKSTRLNSSHVKISYAIFCLKNKQINIQ